MTVTSAENAVRARRRLTNKLIAAKVAPRLRPFFATHANVTVGGSGGVLMGADAIIDTFASQFRDPAFVAYVRTTDTVEIAEDGLTAAETGHWVGTWTDDEMSGAYMAAWARVRGQWVIERELFITLKG